MIVPAVLFSVLGLLFIGLSIPMMRRRVPPNRWYGLRTAATLGNEKVWYEANAISGRDLFRVGVVTVATSWVLPVMVSAETQAVLQSVLLFTLSIAAAIRGVLLANRLARR